MKSQMKTLFFSLIALLLASSGLQAQTIQVYYKKFIVPGQIEYGRWATSPEMKRQLREREEKMADNISEYYYLTANPRQAYFWHDTTIQLAPVDEGSPWWSMMNAMKFTQAQNLRTGDVTLRSDMLPDSLCTAVNFREKYQWTPGDGLRVFAGVECRPLVHQIDGNSQVVVWYAPGIPIPSGPEDFAGAPGLILAVEAPAYNFIAEKIEVGDFTVEKAALPSESCLDEEAFRRKVREVMMNKFLKE
jgi:GLPGLI family protein